MTPTSEASLGTLVRGAMDDFRDLIREEIALARSEMRFELSKATAAGVKFGIAGVALLFAAMFLLVAVALGISALANWPAWAGFASVGIVLAIAGAIFASSGRRAISTVQPLPRTVAALKGDV